MNLERNVLGNGVAVYVSRALARVGVPHGFSTRIGGVSEGAFGTMNLGNPSGVADCVPALMASEDGRVTGRMAAMIGVR